MIETLRLTLKPYSDQDQDKMIELLTHPIIKETFIIPDFKTKEEAVIMFEKLKDYSFDPHHYERGIYLKGELIGFVNDVEINGKSIELGYVIHPDHHHQGYATEALQAVIQDLFNAGYTEVITGAFEKNRASCRVMEKCGMQLFDRVEDMEYQGVLQRCIYYHIQKK